MIRKISALTSLLLAVLSVSPDLSYAMAKKPSLPQESDASAASKLLPRLTLEDCFRLALKQSETIKMKKEDVSETTADFLIATGEAVGDIDFVMTDYRQEPQRARASASGVESTSTAAERRERKFTYSQPIFQGFKSLGALTGAGSLRNQRQEEKARAVQLLYLEVSHAFYTLMAHHKDVIIIKSISALVEDRIAELKARERIGRSRPSEIATVQSKLRRLEAELARSEGDLMISRHLLTYFTGAETGTYVLKEPARKPVTPPLEELLEAVDDRADVKASEQAMKTSKRGMVVAQSVLWPKVSLDMNQYEKREGFQSGIDWDLLVKMDVPLFRGGTSFGEIKQSISAYKKAKLNYEKTKREAELNIKEAFEDWKASVAQTKSLADAVKAAETNYKLQKDDYERNLVSNLDVLEALESLLNARREANTTLHQMKENFWKLQIAGGMDPEFNPLMAADPSAETSKP